MEKSAPFVRRIGIVKLFVPSTQPFPVLVYSTVMSIPEYSTPSGRDPFHVALEMESILHGSDAETVMAPVWN